MPAPRVPATPQPPATPTTPTTQPNPPSLSVSVKGSPKKSGIKLEVKVAGKGKLSAVAKSGSRTVGKASTTVKQASKAQLKLKVSRKGKLSVKVTFKPATGATLTKTVSVKVR